MNTEVENFLASHPYSVETKAAYRPVLDELTGQPFEAWAASDLLNFVTRSNWGNSRQYVNLCACRKFIAWKFGQSHPALNARLKRIKPKKGRSLSFSQLVQLLASFNTYTAIGARDLALAALAIDTGLRESELARLQLVDIQLENRTLQVIVKGGQWETAVYSHETAMAVDRWLNYRTPAPGVGSVFVSMAPNKRAGQQLTKHGIKAIFKKWGCSLGWKMSPHDARRTFGNLATLLGSPQSVTMAAGRWHNEEAFRRYTQEITALAITPYLPVAHAMNPKS